MLSCYDVAQYFLAKADEDAGDLMSNLKLQKFVYYAQGFALALLDKPLFPQCIEAWIHGPVVPALYHAYKSYGTEAIPSPRELDFSKYDQETRGLLDEVYAVYGQFAAWKLRNMTHQEPPWCTTPAGQEITHDALRAYFKTQVDV
jgi:uncharacterized phage-associated protein